MTEEYNKRRLAANKALLDAINKIDPSDPDATKKYEAISKLYHELNADIKNELDKTAKAEELVVEREKIESEKATKAEAIKAERERTEAEAKSEKTRSIIDISGKIAMAVATVFAAISQLWMFKRSTEKEVDEAILTQTDQTVVKNGLSGRFWKR